MEIFRSLEASASALTAERLWLDIVADNIANANTTRTATGEPFRRRIPVFAPRTGAAAGGVQVVAVIEDLSPFRLRYEPGHPDADENGYVRMPNVDVIKEMVDMIAATRAYEANVTAINAAKGMFLRALDIGRA